MLYTLEIMLQNSDKKHCRKVEVKRLRDAPARLTVSLVGPANGSHDFPPAAKRLAVLLLAIGVGRGRRGAAYPRLVEGMLRNGRNSDKTLPRKCDRNASGTPARGLRPA